jgi:hypothetical protein
MRHMLIHGVCTSSTGARRTIQGPLVYIFPECSLILVGAWSRMHVFFHHFIGSLALMVLQTG